MTDLKDTQYVDILWLQTFGLSKLNVLEYFYSSPFFDQNSNNYTLWTQGIGNQDHLLLQMTGIEYTLDEKACVEPTLYVIRKMNRLNPQKTMLLEIYYCLEGVIYQSPIFITLLRSRISKISNNLLRAYESYEQSIQDERTKEENTTQIKDDIKSSQTVNLPSLNNAIENLKSIV